MLLSAAASFRLLAVTYAWIAQRRHQQQEQTGQQLVLAAAMYCMILYAVSLLETSTSRCVCSILQSVLMHHSPAAALATSSCGTLGHFYESAADVITTQSSCCYGTLHTTVAPTNPVSPGQRALLPALLHGTAPTAACIPHAAAA